MPNELTCTTVRTIYIAEYDIIHILVYNLMPISPPGIPTPTKELMEKVTNHIEEWDRRIVGFEEETGSFIVYCPTPDALSDLWAMCDRINKVLVETLLPSSNDTAVSLLHRFCLKRVLVRTIIKGPEFLKYKQELMSTRM